MSVERVRVSDIRVDPKIQARAGDDEDAVSDYATAWDEGAEFNPVELFRDDDGLWIGDGNHRVLAARRAEKVEFVPAIVKPGGRRAAFLRALGANDDNGLRRTQKDRNHALRMALADDEISGWTNEKIASHVRISVRTVQRARNPKPAVEPGAGSPVSTATDMGDTVTPPAVIAMFPGATRTTTIVGRSPGDDEPDEEDLLEFTPERLDREDASEEAKFIASLPLIERLEPKLRDRYVVGALVWFQSERTRTAHVTDIRARFKRLKNQCRGAEPMYVEKILYPLRMRGGLEWIECKHCDEIDGKRTGKRTIAGSAVTCPSCEGHGYRI